MSNALHIVRRQKNKNITNNTNNEKKKKKKNNNNINKRKTLYLHAARMMGITERITSTLIEKDILIRNALRDKFPAAVGRVSRIRVGRG